MHTNTCTRSYFNFRHSAWNFYLFHHKMYNILQIHIHKKDHHKHASHDRLSVSRNKSDKMVVTEGLYRTIYRMKML